jgi:hypothetical protein
LPSTSLFLVIAIIASPVIFVFGRKLVFLLILYVPCCC